MKYVPMLSCATRVLLGALVHPEKYRLFSNQWKFSVNFLQVDDWGRQAKWRKRTECIRERKSQKFIFFDMKLDFSSPSSVIAEGFFTPGADTPPCNDDVTLLC